jgi:hypothetical protein
MVAWTTCAVGAVNVHGVLTSVPTSNPRRRMTDKAGLRLPFAEELDAAIAAVEAVTERAREVAALRAAARRSISAANQDRLKSLGARLEALARELEPAANPGHVDVSAALLAEYERFKKASR